MTKEDLIRHCERQIMFHKMLSCSGAKKILIDFLIPIAGEGGVERVLNTVSEYLNGNDGKNCDLSYIDVRLAPDGTNLLLDQPECGLGISLNFDYNDVIPSPEETLQKSRTRRVHPEFRIHVPQGTQRLYVMPVTNSHYARVYLDGNRADPTYLHPVMLTGERQAIELRCVSEDGSAERTYAIHVDFE